MCAIYLAQTLRQLQIGTNIDRSDQRPLTPLLLHPRVSISQHGVSQLSRHAAATGKRHCDSRRLVNAAHTCPYQRCETSLQRSHSERPRHELQHAFRPSPACKQRPLIAGGQAESSARVGGGFGPCRSLCCKHAAFALRSAGTLRETTLSHLQRVLG